MSDKETIWLEGLVSIEAAMQSGSREVETIYLHLSAKRKQDRRVGRLCKTAVSQNIPITEVDADYIEARVSGKSHGGVIAAVGPRRFVALDALLVEGIRPFIVMLDGIEDPFNFGQAIRSLYAAGVDGIVVRPRNWTTAAAVVARASAGATELVPMAIAETAEAAAQFFKTKGLAIACTSDKQAQSIYQTDLTVPLFLLIGGEKRGITRSFLDQADLLLQIPYQQTTYKQSLGTVASAAIIGFEVMRQRGERPEGFVS